MNRGIFVGYCEDTKRYRIYDPVSGEFRISRDVVVLAKDVASARAACGRETQPVEFIEPHFEDLLVPTSTAGDSDDGLQDEAAAPTTDADDIRSNVDEQFVDATDSANVALRPQINKSADVQQGLRRSDRVCPFKFKDYIIYGTFSGKVLSPQLPPKATTCEMDDPTTYEAFCAGQIEIIGSKR